MTADHGESLGEHGEPTHGFFVYQPTLRVPLVLAGPGVPRGERRPGPARTADVTPTLLALLGLGVPAGLDGRNLLAGPLPRESYAETLYPASFGWAPLFSYRLGSLKLVDAPRPELYDLAADPGEATNLAEGRTDDLARLRQALAAFRGADTPATARPLDPETEERLRCARLLPGRPLPRPCPASRSSIPRTRSPRSGNSRRRPGPRAAAIARRRSPAFGVLPPAILATPSSGGALAAALRRAGQKDEAARVASGPGEDAVLVHERALAQARRAGSTRRSAAKASRSR